MDIHSLQELAFISSPALLISSGMNVVSPPYEMT